MADVAMHRTPHWSVPARRQFALVKDSQGPWFMIAACCFSMFVVEFVRFQQMRDSGWRGPIGLQYPMVAVLSFLYVLSAAWPLLVWRDESWGKREYHWSLPVASSTHDLWRVVSGAAWLMVSIAVCAVLGMTLIQLHGGAPVHLPNGSRVYFHPGAPFWLSFFAGPLIIYTFASILPIALRRPMEWGAAIVGGFTLWMLASEITRSRWMSRWWYVAMTEGPVSMERALGGGMSTQWNNFLSDSGWAMNRQPPVLEELAGWILSVALWLGLGVFGVVLAVRRRR